MVAPFSDSCLIAHVTSVLLLPNISFVIFPPSLHLQPSRNTLSSHSVLAKAFPPFCFLGPLSFSSGLSSPLSISHLLCLIFLQQLQTPYKHCHHHHHQPHLHRVTLSPPPKPPTTCTITTPYTTTTTTTTYTTSTTTTTNINNNNDH